MNNGDERQGMPSASNFARYELCAGSFQLEAEARRIGQAAHQESKDAARGTRIHAWLAGEPIELEGEELETAMALRDRAQAQIARVFGDVPYTELKEKRVWLKQPTV